MLTCLVLITSWMEDVQALTTQQIVNQSKPSVVAIILSNSTNYRYSEGTGWFISENRIVTNSHVINAEGFDHYEITNLTTGQNYLIDHLAYNNVATDIAIVVVKETNPTHLVLSNSTPTEGMPVVMIGNPKGNYGKIITGTLGETVLQGITKRDNGTLINADIQGGASGSPVLDPNGDVIGMIWGSLDTTHNGIAVTLQSLALAQLDVIDISLVAAPPAQTQTPSNQRVSTPDAPTITEEDKVAQLIYNYLNATQNGKPVSLVPYVTNTLYSWYGDKDVPRERAEKENVDYYRHWPNQAIQFDPNKIWVKRVERKGNPTYHVQVPFSYFISNAKETKKGEKVFDAIVILTTNGVGYRIIEAQNL
jgi:Trypsin-like peptidase domain